MRLSTDRASPWFSDPASAAGWRTERWATPFSGFAGRCPRSAASPAGDLHGHRHPRPRRYRGCGGRRFPRPAWCWHARSASFRFCVSLWDCAAAKAHLPPLEALQRDPQGHARCTRYFEKHPHLVSNIDPAYNSVDGDHQPADRIRMLHYSDMGTQFSHPRALARLASEGGRTGSTARCCPIRAPTSPPCSTGTSTRRSPAVAGSTTIAIPDPFGPVVKKSSATTAAIHDTAPIPLAVISLS
jgi:hypothetical protein